jgi:hypothetical protein
MTSLSSDPAAQLLSANRNQTVAQTGVGTGRPGSPAHGGDPMRGMGGVHPGSATGIGPCSGQEPAGAVGNTQNTSAGAPTGSGDPGVDAGGLKGQNSFPNLGGLNTYTTVPAGQQALPDPEGGANGVTPSNAWELVSRTS